MSAIKSGSSESPEFVIALDAFWRVRSGIVRSLRISASYELGVSPEVLPKESPIRNLFSAYSDGYITGCGVLVHARHIQHLRSSGRAQGEHS